MAWIDNKIANLEQSKKNINQKVLRGEMSQDEANQQLERLNMQLQQARQQQQQTQQQQAQQQAQAQQPSQQAQNAVGANSPTQAAITAGLTSHFYSRDPSGTAAGKRETADIAQKQAAQEQINAQQNAQIANRNYRGEAEKNAVAQAATENAQKLASMGAAAGGGAAALNRTVETPDYNTHMQRSDEQRQKGVEQQREGTGYEQSAALQRGKANVVDYRTGARQIQSIYNDFITKNNYGDEDVDFRKEQTVKMLQDVRLAIDTAVRTGSIPKDDADELYTLVDSTIEKVQQGNADNYTVANTLNQLEGRGIGI